MNKSEFLYQLESKLSKIDESERKDIIIEYGSYIDDKVNDGATEEEAVAGFGDIDELVVEILEAYDFKEEDVPPFEQPNNSTKDAIYEKAENVWNETKELTFNDVLKLVVDAFLILAVLWLIKMVVIDLLFGLFLGGLFKHTLGTIYVVLALYFAYRVLLVRMKQLKNPSTPRNGILDDMKNVFNQTIGKDETNEDLPPIPNEEDPIFNKQSSNSDYDVIKKIFLIFAWFLTICIFIGVFACFCVLVYFQIAFGAWSYGLYTIIAGCILLCVGFMMLWISLWPRKRGYES